MVVNYQKVWSTMNDLEMITSKIVSAREIIDTAAEAIQNHDYNRAETLAMAAYEFLGYYLDEFDAKFKLAWQETVVKQKKEEDDAWDAVNKEKEYYEPSMPPWGHSDLECLVQNKEPVSCDKDDPSPECKGAWNDFWDNYQGSTVSSVHYTDEEMDAMCDKAASDQEKEQCREYNLREAEYYDKRAKLDMNYQEAVAAGWEMTGDGFWIPPQKEDKVKKWVLPVEECKDFDTDKTEYFVSFPDDLLEAADLKEGDTVEWVDNNNGSYVLTKVTKPLEMDEC